MNIRRNLLHSLVGALLFANFAGIVSLTAAEQKAPAKSAEDQKPVGKLQTEEPPLVIPDPLPTDPEENAKIAKAILEKASFTMLHTKGFKAKISSQNMGIRQNMFIYQKNNPDGTIWLRQEAMGTIMIKNDEGLFSIVNDVAIKMAYLSDFQDAISGIVPNIKSFDVNGVLNPEISETKDNRYLVKNKLPPDKSFQKEILSVVEHAANEDMKKIIADNKIDLTSFCPVLIEYLIGKEDFFTYSYKTYNKDGKKISEVTYEDVKLGIDLDDSLFKIPPNMEIKTANTITEYTKIVTNLLLGK